jgi:hypothetical protein
MLVYTYKHVKSHSTQIDQLDGVKGALLVVQGEMYRAINGDQAEQTGV